MLSEQHEYHLSIKESLKKAGYLDSTKIANTLQGSIWRSFQQSTNKRVVIKVTFAELHKKNIAFLKENQILKYLSQDKQCPASIIKYIDAFKSKTCYFLVMEDGGCSLFDFIVKAHKCIEVGTLAIAEWHKLVKIIFQQMIESIEYCHSKNVSHFNISLENYLINDLDIYYDVKSIDGKIRFVIDENHPVQIKLCDFGLSELFAKGTDLKFQSSKYCGKINYKSPEITNKKKTFCAKSNDIWCLGACLFMMIIGSPGWTNTSISDQGFNMIINGHVGPLLKAWNRIKYVNKDLIQLFHCFLNMKKIE